MKTISVTDRDHNRIKVEASKQGISIMTYINNLLEEVKALRMELASLRGATK